MQKHVTISVIQISVEFAILSDKKVNVSFSNHFLEPDFYKKQKYCKHRYLAAIKCSRYRHLKQRVLKYKLFIRFTVRVFRERLSVRMCASFPFGFEDGMCYMIVLIPDHCLSIYCTVQCRTSSVIQISVEFAI